MRGSRPGAVLSQLGDAARTRAPARRPGAAGRRRSGPWRPARTTAATAYLRQRPVDRAGLLQAAGRIHDHRREVVGDRGLEIAVQPGREHHRDRDHQHTEGLLQAAGVRPDPARQRAAQRHHREQRDRGTHAVGEAEHQALGGDPRCRARPPQRGSAPRRARRRAPGRLPAPGRSGSRLPARHVRRAATGGSGQSLDRRAQPGHDERQPEGRQHRDRHATREVTRQPQQSSARVSSTAASANVAANPTATPSGRRRPPVDPAARATGSTGSTHGESAVAAPASTANAVAIRTSTLRQ